MTQQMAQIAPQEKAFIRAVRAFVAKHPPAHGNADLYVEDLIWLIRVVIREAAYEVTSAMMEGLCRRGGA